MVTLPFPHYPGKSDATRSAADACLRQRAAYQGLVADVPARLTAASGQSDGFLPEPIEASGTPVVSSAEHLAAAAMVAGGALNGFAGAIDAYDRRVDELNRRYEQARATGFGVPSDAGAQEGMSDAEKRGAHGDAVDAADAELRQQLESERQRAEQLLDEEAEHAASLLRDGPSKEAALQLFMSGDLSAETVASYVGMSLATLNNVRTVVASTKSLEGIFVKNKLGTLAQYLLKINPKALRGRMDMRVAMQMRQVLLANRTQNLALAQRLARYKAGKVDAAVMARNFAQVVRGQNLVGAATPGPLLGNLGANTRYLGTASRVAGKALPFLAIPAGGYTIYDTVNNWGDLSTEDQVTGLVGGVSTTAAGGLGVAALTMGAAFPPAGAALLVGAGAVALGTLVYENREAIADFAVGAGEEIYDAGADLVDAGEQVGEAIGDGVSDFVDDPGGTISDGADAVGDFLGF